MVGEIEMAPRFTNSTISDMGGSLKEACWKGKGKNRRGRVGRIAQDREKVEWGLAGGFGGSDDATRLQTPNFKLQTSNFREASNPKHPFAMVCEIACVGRFGRCCARGRAHPG